MPGPHREEARLSPRQREVVLLLADGLTYKQLAIRLGISVRTVEAHVRQIGTTLRVKGGTTGMLERASKNGLIKRLRKERSDAIAQRMLDEINAI